MKRLWIAAVVFVLIVMAAITLVVIPAPKKQKPSIDFHNTIVFETHDIDGTMPAPGGRTFSPLTITGEAQNNWYFEASFPVQLLDASGTVITQAPAQAQSDWTTSGFVPFIATLKFLPQPKDSKGTLILKNDNPSGDPSKQKELDIPVTF